MQLHDFITLYNTIEPLVPDASHLQELSHNLGVACTITQVVNAIETKVQQLLHAPDHTGNDKSHFSNVVTCLYALHHCRHQNTQPIINAFELLQQFLPNGSNHYLLPFEHTAWHEVIASLKTIQLLKPQATTPICPCWQKEEAYAHALLRLQHKGITFSISGMETISIDNPQHIAKQIHNDVRQLGGQTFMQHMLSQLSYSPAAHRYLLTRQGNNSMPFSKDIDAPCNYMLHIGMRCIKYATTLRPAEQAATYSRIKQTATDLCLVLHPVQSFSIWEDAIPTVDVLDYLRRLLLRDSIFGLTQANVCFVADFCNYLIDAFLSDSHYNHELLTTFRSTMQWFLNKAHAQEFVKVSKSSLHLRARRTTLNTILSAIAIKSNKVNEGFLLPTDYDRYNLLSHPIISFGTHWLLPPTCLMGFSWYEALLALLRADNKTVDNQVGKLMESYIEQKFATIGIHLLTGNYSYHDATGKKKHGECDHLLCTDSTLVLIEDKRKAVTRASKAGNRDQILLDIMASLIASQYQSLRTSATLLTDKALTLTTPTGTTPIQYNGQRFDHISLDLFDFGPVTTRMFVENVLERTLRSTYIVNPDAQLSVAEEKEAQQKIAKCNKYVSELREVVDMHHAAFLKANASTTDGTSTKNKNAHFRPFFGSWFLTLEQLVFLIGQSKDASTFIDNLHRIKYINTGTGEFYNEWHNLANRGL